MTPKSSILVRVYACFFLVVGFAVVVIFYAGRIQFAEGDHWKALSDSLTTDYRTIPAIRGNIYASDGSLVATSMPVYDIGIDTHAEGISKESWEKNKDSLSIMLSSSFSDKSKKEYMRLLQLARKSSNHRFMLLQRKISYEQLKQVKRFPLFRFGKNKGGLVVQEHDIRENPYGNLAFRTIGLHRDNGYSVGLEASFDSILRGRPGKRLMQRIAGGYWMPISDDNDVEPKNGYDLFTTIDMNMQDHAEAALRKALDSNRAEKGCVILMETKSGDIKAIANLKRHSHGVFSEEENYAIKEKTEPGSTIKLASVLCLVEDGLVNDYETVGTGNGTLTVADNVTIKDAELGGHGNLTLRQAFEHSSNVAIAKFVMSKYNGRASVFANHLINDFNLGKKMGISFIGEAQPKVKHPRKDRDWSDATLPEMSIGYEMEVTPLQIAAFYNGVANGGRMMKPRFVTHIEQSGKLVKEYPPEVLSEKMVSQQTIDRVLPMLTGVVEHGTATNLKSKSYTIAGKTGTARILVGKRYVEQYKSSFAGFFPASNPQYTCVVMIFNPTAGKYYGALVAGPVFKEIADKVYATCVNRQSNSISDSMKVVHSVLNVYGYYADLKLIIKNIGIRMTGVLQNSDMASISINKNNAQAKNEFQTDKTVPGVCGLGIRDAVFLLENKGLRVKYTGSGKVSTQSVPNGTNLYKGMEIYLSLS